MGKNILVVDDVATLRRELVFLLEDEDHNPFEAENGIKAIEVLENNTIDLLITDIMMPEMDGIELCSHCRNYFPELKIIVISGGGNLSTAETSDQSDIFTQVTNSNCADAVLKKPFDYDQLVDAIDNLIE